MPSVMYGFIIAYPLFSQKSHGSHEVAVCHKRGDWVYCEIEESGTLMSRNPTDIKFVTTHPPFKMEIYHLEFGENNLIPQSSLIVCENGSPAVCPRETQIRYWIVEDPESQDDELGLIAVHNDNWIPESKKMNRKQLIEIANGTNLVHLVLEERSGQLQKARLTP